MGVEFPHDLKDSNLKISLKESSIDSVDMNDTKLLSRENEKINQENDSRAKIDRDKPDILSLSIYNSTPLILSQTTKAFDRSSAKIYGASVILPYKMERLSRVLEILFKADSGYYNPRMIFELRYYNFEKRGNRNFSDNDLKALKKITKSLMDYQLKKYWAKIKIIIS